MILTTYIKIIGGRSPNRHIYRILKIIMKVVCFIACNFHMFLNYS